MIANLKKIGIVAAVVAVVFVLGAVSGGMIGWQYCKSSQKTAVIKHQDKELKDVAEVHDRKVVRDEKLHKTLEGLSDVKDDRECTVLDSGAPVDFDRMLRDAYRQGSG